MSLAIIYGTTTGNTELAANKIKDELGSLVTHFADVADIKADQLMQYDVLIFGCPTWNVGELQDDWDYFLPEMKDLDLTGKKVALFGLGDAYGYAENFLDALGLLWDEIKELGDPQLVGLWPTEGYEFEESVGLHDDKHFLGLGLDEENQSELHDERIKAWTQQLRQELGLGEAN